VKCLLTTTALLAGVVLSGCDAVCTVVSEMPEEPNDVSAKSIAINFELWKKRITSMEVVHNLGDGREIARSSQYSMKSTIEENKNGDPVAIRWSGKHRKNPNLTMTGTLRLEPSESSDGHPIGYYTETLYDQGRLDHVEVARCKWKEEKTPLPERSDPAPACLKSGETPDPCELQLGDVGLYGPPWPPSLSINSYTTETLQCLKQDGWTPEPCHLRGDSLYYHTPRKPQKRYVLNPHLELVPADWEAIAKHPKTNLFPPAQYDHPYKGARLNIVEVHTQEEVHSGCKVAMRGYRTF
jgi:hypothetical protein